jgi:hypothetical protein
MSISIELNRAQAMHVELSENAITVQLVDGRVISAPLVWYPRLVHGTVAERNNYQITGQGIGIHWPDLDEDISVANLLAGQRSGESQTSFKRWVESRASANRPT